MRGWPVIGFGVRSLGLALVVVVVVVDGSECGVRVKLDAGMAVVVMLLVSIIMKICSTVFSNLKSQNITRIVFYQLHVSH